VPSNLVSDRGATFTPEFSRSLCCRLTGITHGFPSANGRPDRARQFSSRAVSAGILQSSAGRPDGQLFVNGFLLPEFLDSQGTAALFWDGIFRLHGLPSSLGATFTSEFSRSLCCRLTGITYGFPSANGRPDRARQFNWRHASSDPLPSQLASQPEPPPVIIDDQQEWEVEEILDSRRFSKNRLLKYFFRWVGYDHPSWQPATDLEHSHFDPRTVP
jgi:hypothetical protein